MSQIYDRLNTQLPPHLARLAGETLGENQAVITTLVPDDVSA